MSRHRTTNNCHFPNKFCPTPNKFCPAANRKWSDSEWTKTDSSAWYRNPLQRFCLFHRHICKQINRKRLQSTKPNILHIYIVFRQTVYRTVTKKFVARPVDPINFIKHITDKNIINCRKQLTGHEPGVALPPPLYPISVVVFKKRLFVKCSTTARDVVRSVSLVIQAQFVKIVTPFSIVWPLHPAWQAEMYVFLSSPQTGEYLT